LAAKAAINSPGPGNDDANQGRMAVAVELVTMLLGMWYSPMEISES
jgi:hypothetical protein